METSSSNMRLQRRAEEHCSKLSPDILVRSEKNAKDLEKVLLHRALIIKDERIKKLENTLASLTIQLQELEQHKQTRSSEAEKNVTIINNNIYSNFYCYGCTFLLLLGFIKIMK